MKNSNHLSFIIAALVCLGASWLCPLSLQAADDTSCTDAQNQPGFEWLAGDVNHDCKADFVDFAIFAAIWLQENYSTE